MASAAGLIEFGGEVNADVGAIFDFLPMVSGTYTVTRNASTEPGARFPRRLLSPGTAPDRESHYTRNCGRNAAGRDATHDAIRIVRHSLMARRDPAAAPTPDTPR